MKSKNNLKIYSINTENDVDKGNLIEIESVILNGLYKFSILGINQKKSSEIKDRVYSALRYEKLLNLKSDNKKITINLLPTNTEKKDSFYDLAIALSCLINTNQICIEDDFLAIGELSITGKIIPSGFLLKSIHRAINNNIKIIICSKKDIDLIDNMNLNAKELISKNKINFIYGDSLGELFLNIKNKKFYIFKTKDINLNKTTNHKTIKIKDKNIFKIVLAICTNRKIFIENNKDSYIHKFIKNLIYYTNKLNTQEILEMSYLLNVCDNKILYSYTNPIINSISKQTKKEDIKNMLIESIYGFNIVENFIDINEETFHIIKTNLKSSLICFYNTCPCGNNYSFFNNQNQERCLCLQRNILLYKQKIKRNEGGYFDFYIKNISDTFLEYEPDNYIAMNDIISKFKYSEFKLANEDEVGDIMNLYCKNLDKQDLEKITVLTKDIAKLEYILNNQGLKIQENNIKLALDISKKDF